MIVQRHCFVVAPLAVAHMAAMMLCMGCGNPNSIGHFEYAKRSQSGTWARLQINDERGITAIRSWIRTHNDALSRGAEWFPILDIEQIETLYWITPSGKRTQYYLLAEYPLDNEPKAERHYAVNLSHDDFIELRQICQKYGKASTE